MTISISVAVPLGALGNQMMESALTPVSVRELLTAEEGVMIRKASVMPGASSRGRGHCAMMLVLSGTTGATFCS